MNSKCIAIPESILSAGLTSNELLVFISLLALWHQELPYVVTTQSGIVKTSGLSITTVGRALRQLAQKNIITISVNHDKDIWKYLKTKHLTFIRYEISDRYNPRKFLAESADEPNEKKQHENE